MSVKQVQTCVGCGEEFTGQKRKYCNGKCRRQSDYQASVTGRTWTCAGCETEFGGRKRKYCRKECRNRNRERRIHSATCEQCKSEFAAEKSDRRFCSRACHNESMQTGPAEAECRWCGESFKTNWSANRFNTHCSRKCYFREIGFSRHLRLSQKAYTARVRAAHGATTALCASCMTPFAVHDTRQRWCSESCKSDIERRRRKAYYQDTREQRLVQPHPIECGQCGTVFTGKGKRLCRECASLNARLAKRAAKARRRAQIQERTAEVVSYSEVMERDGWKCQMCGVEVDTSADPNSDLYPNVDHMTPLSRDGDHTMDNLVLMCRACNLEKRDMMPLEWIAWVRVGPAGWAG